ncbi:hypothetical protein VUR80DRAFT_10034 [Thermomyces stellatus]
MRRARPPREGVGFWGGGGRGTDLWMRGRTFCAACLLDGWTLEGAQEPGKKRRLNPPTLSRLRRRFEDCFRLPSLPPLRGDEVATVEGWTRPAPRGFVVFYVQASVGSNAAKKRNSTYRRLSVVGGVDSECLPHPPARGPSETLREVGEGVLGGNRGEGDEIVTFPGAARKGKRRQ